MLAMTLRNFSCLTFRDTVLLAYNGNNCDIDVTESLQHLCNWIKACKCHLHRWNWLWSWLRMVLPLRTCTDICTVDVVLALLIAHWWLPEYHAGTTMVSSQASPEYHIDLDWQGDIAPDSSCSTKRLFLLFFLLKHISQPNWSYCRVVMPSLLRSALPSSLLSILRAPLAIAFLSELASSLTCRSCSWDNLPCLGGFKRLSFVVSRGGRVAT
jgi:hypothetical protein